MILVVKNLVNSHQDYYQELQKAESQHINHSLLQFKPETTDLEGRNNSHNS